MEDCHQNQTQRERLRREAHLCYPRARGGENLAPKFLICNKFQLCFGSASDIL